MTVATTAPAIQPRTALNAEQFLLDPDSRWMELVNGHAVATKPVSHASSTTESQINFVLRAFVDRNPVAYVYSSGMSYQCFQNLVDDPDRMRRPDVSVVRRERFLALNNPNPGLLRIPPVLAVEVLSTHGTHTETDEKLAEYEVGGFPLVWVVDPIRRTVTVHPFPGKPYILTADDTITAEAALPGFACKVSDLFPPRE